MKILKTRIEHKLRDWRWYADHLWTEDILYDDLGNEDSRILLTPGGIEPSSVPAVHVPMGQYHTCKSLASGTVIIEFKNTKYDPLTTEDVLEKKE